MHQRNNSRPESLRDHPSLTGRHLKLALYSHDAMGVGHVRRNVLIAQSLSMSPVDATSLLICGVHEATAFTGGHGIDCLTLPSLTKHGTDDYRPRDLRLSREHVSEIRTATLTSALLAFEPDLLLVDKVPRGLHRELDKVLPTLRANGKTKVVFGMRDILDAPEYVAEEWQRHQYEKFVQENYDEVWVYGDPMVFDPIEAYGFHGLRSLTHYTGYIDQQERLLYADALERDIDSLLTTTAPTTLCMVGGGQDGDQLARAFAEAKLPGGHQGLLITGPLMAVSMQERIAALAADRADLTVVTSVRDADLLMPRVDRVICMGGYNSLLSVASFEKPALIVPRVHPRQEQLIRADRFRELGLVDVLPPDQLSPAALTAWLARGNAQPRPNRSRLDLGGLKKIQRLTVDLVTGSVPGHKSPPQQRESAR